MVEGNTDLEIGDVENYSNKDEVFSHSALVMQILRKCLEAGSVEMRSGYTQKKIDKSGNAMEIYIPDGRKTFVACIETAIAIMCCDFDKDAEDNISKLLEDFETQKKTFIEHEKIMWENMSEDKKRMLMSGKDGLFPMPGFIVLPINKELLTEYQLNIHKKIFAELTLLTKRIDFYQEEMLEG